MKTKKNIFKMILVVLLLLIAISTVYSQDMIVMRDGTSIDAIILEVSPSEIRFRRAENPEGTVRTLRTSEVNMIIYENRSVEVFHHQESNRGGGRIEFAKPRISAFYGFSLSKFGGDLWSDDDDNITNSQKAGFVNLGASIWLPNLLPYSIIEPGIRLINKGMEEEWQDDYWDHISGSFSQNLLYLDIFGKARLDALPMPLYPYVGFSTGFLLNAKYKDEYTYAGETETTTEDNKDFFNTMDFGLLFGLDLLIQNRVTLGFEYNLGLSNIDKVYKTDEYKPKNRTMLFTIGVLF